MGTRRYSQARTFAEFLVEMLDGVLSSGSNDQHPVSNSVSVDRTVPLVAESGDGGVADANPQVRANDIAAAAIVAAKSTSGTAAGPKSSKVDSHSSSTADAETRSHRQGNNSSSSVVCANACT